MNDKTRRILTWIALGFLCLLFAGQALAKLLGLEFERAAFERWGYPAWFMYVVGTLEAAGVVGLLIPRLRALAALGLVGLMCGAVVTHVRTDEFRALPLPIVAGSIAGWVAWDGRATLRALFSGAAARRA